MSRLLFDKARNLPALALAVVFGRLPIWVLLIALSSQMIHPQAFACLYTLLLCCRAYLMWYETGASGAKLLIKTMWRHFLRWVLYYVIAEIVVFALVYTVFQGSRFDHALLLMAFGLYIPVMVLQILIPPAPRVQRNTYFKRAFPMPQAVLLLWIYVVLSNEAAIFKCMALSVAYVLEFFAIYEPVAHSAEKTEGGAVS